MPAPLIKNQHYVPRSYLKLFSDTGKSKMVYAFRPHDERGPSRVEYKSIKSIASEDYFYETTSEFKKLSGSRTQENEIEKTAFPYENSHLKETIKTFESAESISQKNIEDILNLALQLKRRNPSFLDGNHGYNAADKLTPTLSLLTKRFKEKYPTDQFHLANLETEVSKRNDILKTLPNLNGAFARDFGLNDYPNIAERKALIELQAGITIRQLASSENPFISSDNPGFTWNRYQGLHTTGLSFWDTYTFIASPKSALFCIKATSLALLTPGLYDIKARNPTIEETNLKTCINSLKHVYGGNEAHVNLVRDQLLQLMKTKDLPNGVFKKSRSW